MCFICTFQIFLELIVALVLYLHPISVIVMLMDRGMGTAAVGCYNVVIEMMMHRIKTNEHKK